MAAKAGLEFKMEETNKTLSNIIVELASKEAPITDIHIEAEEYVRTKRPEGWKDEDQYGVISGEMIDAFMSGTWGEEFNQFKTSLGSLDRSVPFERYRLRINAFHVKERTRVAMSIRKHPLTPMDLDRVELSQKLKALLKISSRGLFVVTGPTGSGKTTTLAAILNYFNKSAVGSRNVPRKLHIHTIEDPIEYVHERANCMMTQKSVGLDCTDFASGLRDSLRQRADIIMVGEVRDKETAETMLNAAESGHLVLATMHTNNAPAVITRILSFFPEDQHKMILNMLSSNLLGISCQAMVASADNTTWEVASESIINSNSKMTNLLSTGNTHGIMDIMRKGSEGDDASYLNHKLSELVRAHKITADSAIRASYQPVELMSLIKS